MVGRVLLFQVLVPSNDTVDSESAMAIKPSDSDEVVEYQVDEITHSWSAEWFVAHSHIYPWFTGKVLSLIHFPLEPSCEDYFFLDKAVANFEQGLDSILTDSLKTYNWTHPWIRLMLLHLQSLLAFSAWLVLFLIILNCSLLLALGLINCGARLGPFLHLCLWLPRCQHPNGLLFFSHPAAFRFCPLHRLITSP